MATLRLLIRTISVHLYWLIFIVLISLLPITVQFWAPLQPYFLGLYRDLGAWDLFFVSLFGAVAVWSLMITQALVIDGVEARFLIAGNGKVETKHKAFGQLPSAHLRLLPLRWEKLLNWPLTWQQILLYFVFSLPGLGTVVYHSEAPWLLRLLAVGCGLALAFVFMFILTLPAFWAGETTIAVANLSSLHETWQGTKQRQPKLVASAPLRLLRQTRRQLSRFFFALRKGVSRLLRGLGMNHILEEVKDEHGHPQQLMASSHFLALVTMMVLSAGYFGMRWLVRPPSTLELPAVAHLLILITLLIWLVQFADFHLSLLRLPTYLCLIVLIFTTQCVRQSDYSFAVQQRPTASISEALTPVVVVKGSRQPQNLVVITSTGGGILAAGWTTQALQKLIATRPEIAQELRLISAASGGSVGAAFYLDGLLQHFAEQEECQPPAGLLQAIHDNSVKSSLSAAAYGFSFIDFWTILAGGPLLAKTDRGQLLDEKWAFNARDTLDAPPLLSEFRAAIRQGCLPAPILNTTVMENGRRLMITPVDFLNTGNKRAMTLSEYLFSHDHASDAFNVRDKLDINLWTAARLSATFPYISPAVRADLTNTELANRKEVFLGHHFLDGGYHDNYGVASAIDWLDAVLEARQNGADLAFQRILIIQLRVSPTDDTRNAPAVKGHIASFLGPLVGLFQIRNGAAYARNEVELDRFINGWNARLEGEVDLKTVILEPLPNDATAASAAESGGRTKTADAPLSWHLTHSQLDDLHTKFWHPALNDCLTQINQYLGGDEAAISSACSSGIYKR